MFWTVITGMCCAMSFALAKAHLRDGNNGKAAFSAGATGFFLAAFITELFHWIAR